MANKIPLLATTSLAVLLTACSDHSIEVKDYTNIEIDYTPEPYELPPLPYFSAAGADTSGSGNDIKPALDNGAFDAAEMKLVKLIHKKITEKAKAEAGEMANYADELESGEALEMVAIPGGKFTWKGEKADDVLDVTLSPFWMGKTEISWEIYAPFMEPNIKRKKDGHVEFAGQAVEDIDFIARPTPQYHAITHGMARDGYPATGMTHHAANKFCQWLSLQTGHFYRLPTEAEWEYACRAGKDQNYAWGSDEKAASEFAWFAGGMMAEYNGPGQKKPNAFGLNDMHGNMQEWTLDQFVPHRKNYFGKGSVTNPWIKATKPYPHVTKGGHWRSKDLTALSASARWASAPQWKKTDPQDPKSLWYLSDAPWQGLRVVRPKEIPTVEEMYHYWNSGTAADGDMAVYSES